MEFKLHDEDIQRIADKVRDKGLVISALDAFYKEADGRAEAFAKSRYPEIGDAYLYEKINEMMKNHIATICKDVAKQLLDEVGADVIREMVAQELRDLLATYDE